MIEVNTRRPPATGPAFVGVEASRGKVLVVVRLDAMTSSLRALSRALHLAWRHGGSLEVLLVHDVAAASSSAHRRLRAFSTGQLFALLEALRHRVVKRLPEVEFVIRGGRLVDVVRHALERSRPALAVVGEKVIHGGRWARIVARTGVPVLVARRSRKGGVIVAATDATDPSFPTLTSAARFFEEEGTIELLHNFEGHRASSGDVRGRLRRRFEQRARILRAAAMQRTPSPHVVLTSSDQPALGIIDHCSRRDADLVVIGVHRRSQPLRSAKRVAATLIERVERSVLVVPLADSLSWAVER